jgi:alpha-tubulin suppressor-like RCC1 family protein
MPSMRQPETPKGGWKQVNAGGSHTIALGADGSVACWGPNAYGQCNVPPGLGTVSAVAAGQLHTVALLDDGSVACWGDNFYGQCTVPIGLGTVSAVAAGGYHTVALEADGSVACWGYNGDGQCSVPAGLGTVSAVAAGFVHTLALKADGSVACWGSMYEDFRIPWELSDDGWLNFLADYRHSLLEMRTLSKVVPARIRRHPEYRGICAMQKI